MAKTGKVPTVKTRAIPSPSKKKPNFLVWLVGLLLFAGACVGLYFALREKPPRHVDIAEMERLMIEQLEDYFSMLNVPSDEARHELQKWYYRPVEGHGPDATSKYKISDPIPISEQQDRYIWEPNAVIIEGLPCTYVGKVFDDPTYTFSTDTLDDGHRKTTGDMMIDQPCRFENLIYFLGKPSVYKDYCIRCGKVYDLPALPQVGEPTQEKWNPEDRIKDRNKDAEAKFKEIATKYNIEPAVLAKRIKYALEFAPVWPEKVNEIPEEERRPEYYTGRVRYLKLKYFWDQAARSNQTIGETTTRFVKIWPGEKDDNGKLIKEGTQLFRRGQLWMMEAEFEFRNGNIVWKSEVGPSGKVIKEIHEYCETEDNLTVKAKKDAEEAKKKGNAKKKPAEAPVDTPKPDEKKPDEKK
jgi:hypothetical protein